MKKIGSRNDLRTLILMSSLLLTSTILLLVYILDYQDKLVKSLAIESAHLYSDAIVKVRTLYTEKVIARINHHPDIAVVHDYELSNYAVPLPATFSLELGEEIGKGLSGAKSLLYSPYPFPWRKTQGGLKDRFMKTAWIMVNDNPKKPYYEFTEYKGKKVLRYAVADLMRPACLNCHNSHAMSPKKGWKLSDVRGVLEVIHPMENILLKTRNGSIGLFIFAGVFVAFGIFILLILFVRFRNTTAELENTIILRSQEIEKTQLKLHEAEHISSMSKISSGLAHEINQPLSSIQLSADALVSTIDNNDHDGSSKNVTRIIKQVDRIKKITGQLNVFSEDNSTEFKTILLNTMIENVVHYVETQFQEKLVKLDNLINIDATYILGNETELERVFINLLINALHSVENEKLTTNKVVTVDAYLLSDTVTILIADRGYGISKQDQDKIFDPFYTTKEVGKGTGLGLSICVGIIKKHHGVLSYSKHHPKGSVFSVSFTLLAKKK